MFDDLPNKLFQSIDEFNICEKQKPLGVGSFGVVRKARHKLSHKEYAIKIVKIDKDMNEAELLLLSRQISIHYNLDHPHIIKLWGVLTEKDKLYMVMDYAENGNLFRHMVEKKGLSEQQAAKYFYQVTAAVDYLHKNDVFHRDIKPENILIDHNMNIKLCDFGWVADQIHRKRTTFCGTYQYMSPQMVYQKFYDYRIDLWALGVLLYELIHCRAPFPAKSLQEIKKKFTQGVYEIKQKISEQYKKLIVLLLQFQPQKRMDMSLVKKSSWIMKWTGQDKIQKLKSQRYKSQLECPTQDNKSLLKQNFGNKEGQKFRKGHKKYKTLQQQDLYCLGQSAETQINKNSTPRLNKRYQKQNNNYDNRQNDEKKKIIGMRTHTRNQSNDLMFHKFGKVIKQKQRIKLSSKQEKRNKKPTHKRI